MPDMGGSPASYGVCGVAPLKSADKDGQEMVTLLLGFLAVAAGALGIRFAAEVEEYVADVAPMFARSYTKSWAIASGALFIAVGVGLMYVSF